MNQIMKKINQSIFALGTVSLLFLGACNNSRSTTESEPTAPTTQTEPPAKDPAQPTAGGQVVEVGKYHLEFVPEAETETNEFHLDFYLQSGNNHEPITDAQVTGQIKLPSGEEKTVDFTYDTKGGHYTGILPTVIAGNIKRLCNRMLRVRR